jgi:hypothetical protein
MAAPTAEERPDRCQLCGARLAEGAVGFVCEHVAHGAMLTVLADAPSKRDPVPDMLCTACGFALEAERHDAEREANLHVVCARCYREARARNIADFTEADRARGYALARRAAYDGEWKRPRRLTIGPVSVGRTLKLGFSPIPSQHPISLERMWVEITRVLAGGELHGVLANDPQLFASKTLKAGDPVVFTEEHVLEIEREPGAATATAKAKTTATAKTTARRAARPRNPRR